MSSQQSEGLCGVIATKLVGGKSLTPEERNHLAECAACMEEVVRKLDQAHRIRIRSNGSGYGNGVSQPTEEAQRALEHGRKMFEREFGLSLGK